ncbi:hypothetical protein OEA41_008043 [Lepraria neglecta]|uniref:ATPase AAA-type core domain-containing protein n=1 Tax=Lepraria neglecta TaxID=209136 RepID=A0AAD9ZDZ0_9LECA|nr:hypothetical protein OEA41_008043 [Lepraria neglecta]
MSSDNTTLPSRSRKLCWDTDCSRTRRPWFCFSPAFSGHGKTELARRMDSLLSLDLPVVNCTEMRMEIDIFGPKAPYQSHQAGTPLNNHLAKLSGQRAVVFLDEYEKTTDDVRKSMLLLFENGDYKDRRNHKQLDCSQIIWVLATNFGVEIVSKFWTKYLKDRSLEQQKKAPFKTLEASLKTKAISEISAPFPGHSFINYVDDGSIATWLAKDGYDVELGARSLESAVVRGIQRKVTDAFFGEIEKVTDGMNDRPLPNYNVRVVTVCGDVSEVTVECKDARKVQERNDWVNVEEMKVEEEL